VTQNRLPPGRFDSLEVVLASLKLMESTMLGIRQVRQFVGGACAAEMVDLLIQEGELQVAEVKRKIIL